MKHNRRYFPDYLTEYPIQGKGNLYFGDLFVAHIRGYFPQKESADESGTLDLYANYLDIMLKQRHISIRLDDSVKNTLIGLIGQIFDDNDSDNNLKQVASQLLQELKLLPFRKMKFSSKIYYDKDDLDLVRRLRRKFKEGSMLVIGNWSAPNVKFQEPTRNKGLIRMLKKNGFPVFLIDEFKTSSFCPECEHALEKFKTIPNPRPHKRTVAPTVVCHGLLRYVIRVGLKR